MATPKGNAIAYQALKYTEPFKASDFTDKMIDQFVADKKAADAAKLKSAEDQGKNIYDAVKGIKIDPIQTVGFAQDNANKMFHEAFDAVAEAQRVANDINIPIEEKQRIKDIALKKEAGYKEITTFLGTKEQLDLFNEKLSSIGNGEIFEGDSGLEIMNAIKNQAAWIGYDEKGNPIMKYVRPGSAPSDDPVTLSLTQAKTAMLNNFEKDLLHRKDGLYDQMKSEATTMSKDITDGIGGNRTTTTFEFNRADGEANFNRRFGDFDLNNTDRFLYQFAYKVLKGRGIETKEDYEKVKTSYIDKLDEYVKYEKSTVDKYMPVDIEGKNLENKKKIKELNKPEEIKLPKVTISANTSGIPRIIKASSDGRTQDGDAEVYIGGININIDKKEPVLAYKTPNKNGKGYHVEVAVIGKDEDGRAAFKTITTKSDIAIRLAGYGLDYNQFEKEVMKTAPVVKKKVKTSAKTLKEYNQSKEFTSDDDGW